MEKKRPSVTLRKYNHLAIICQQREIEKLTQSTTPTCIKHATTRRMRNSHEINAKQRVIINCSNVLCMLYNMKTCSLQLPSLRNINDITVALL